MRWLLLVFAFFRSGTDTCWGAIVIWKLVTVLTWLLFILLKPQLSLDNFARNEMENINVLTTSRYAAWMSWDGASYQHIALHWYGDSQTIEDRLYHAHYPLLPTILRYGFAFGINTLTSSVIICQIVSIAALRALYMAWRCYFSEADSVRAIWLFCSYPWSLFMEQVYTEGITVFLLSILIIATHKNRLLLACLTALLLPCARPTGHLVTVSLVLCLMVTRDIKRWIWPSIAASAGSGIYFMVMWLSTGDAWAGFSAQQLYPAKGTLLKLFNPLEILHGFANVTETHYMHKSLIDRILFLCFILEAWIIAARCQNLFVKLFSLIAGLIPGLSNLFFSFARFHLLCLISLPWTISVKKISNCGYAIEIIIVGLVLKAALLWRHWTFHWAG